MPLKAVDHFLKGREAYLKARSDQQAQAEGMLFALVEPAIQQIAESLGPISQRSAAPNPRQLPTSDRANVCADPHPRGRPAAEPDPL